MGLMFVGNGNPVWFSWKFIWCILSVFHRKAYFSFLPSSVPKPNTLALSKLHDERYLSSSFFSSWTQLLCWKIFMWDEIVNSGLHRCSLLKVNIWIETCSWLYIFFPEDKQLLPPLALDNSVVMKKLFGAYLLLCSCRWRIITTH